MLDRTTSTPYALPEAPSPTGLKKKLLMAASEEKAAKLAPTLNEKKLSFWDQVDEAAAEMAATDATQKQKLWEESQGVIDRSDPNSELNEGQWVTDAESVDGSLGDKLINAAAGVKKGLATDILGSATSAYHSLAGGSTAKYVQPGAGEAYAKESKHKELLEIQGDFKAETAQLRKEGKLSDSEALGRTIQFENALNEHTLSPEEEKILNQRVHNTHRPFNPTNRELIEEANENFKTAETIEKTVDEALGGTRNHSEYAGDQLMAKFGELADKYSKTTDEAVADMREGKVLQGITKGFPAYAAQIGMSILAAVKEPNAAMQVISEEMPDLITARFGPLGVGLSAMESIGRAGKMQAEGIQNYRKEHNGAFPDEEGMAQIAIASWAAASLDMLSDLTVSGATKGIKALQKTEKVTSKTTKVAKAAGGAATNVVMESVTEGAESLLDDYTSELKSIGSTREALINASAGAVAGGGVGAIASKPVASAAKGVAKGAVIGAAVAAATPVVVANITKDKLNQKKKDKAAKADGAVKNAESRSDAGYTEKINKAAEEKDYEQFKDNPIAAVDTLKKMAEADDATEGIVLNSVMNAQQVREDFKAEGLARMREYKALKNKKDRTPEDDARGEELYEALLDDKITLRKLNNAIAAMNPQDANYDDLVKKLQKAEADGTVDNRVGAIVDILGSGGMTSGVDFSKAIDDSEATPEEKAFYISRKKLDKTRETLLGRGDQSGKGTQDVSGEIFQGSTDFLGIDKQSGIIATALQAEDPETAQRSFTQLEKFAAVHAEKKDILKIATKAAKEGKPLSPENQLRLDAVNAKRDAGDWDFKNPVGMAKILTAMDEEVIALDQAVDSAVALFKVRGYEAKREHTVSETPAEAPKKETTTQKTEPKEKSTQTPSPEKTPSPDKEVSEERAAKNKSKVEVVVTGGAVATKETILAGTLTETESAVSDEDIANPDMDRKINHVRAFFKSKTSALLNTNLLQTIPHFRKTMAQIVASRSLGEIVGVFSTQSPVKQQDANLIDSLTKFQDEFATHAHGMFLPEKNEIFKALDPMQFLAQDGVLPENVVDSLAAVSFKWLSTRAKETLYNDDRAIENILDLPADTRITETARQLTQHMGVNEKLIYKDLGRQVYDLLGLAEEPNAPRELKERLQQSLGMMALATMEDMQLVESARYFSGIQETTNDDQPDFIGLAAVRQNLIDPNSDIKISGAAGNWQASTTDTKKNAGKHSIVFYQVANTNDPVTSTIIPSERVQVMAAKFNAAPHLWDRMFKGTGNSREYSWEPIKYPKQMPLKGTLEVATEKQTANIVNNINRGWKISKNSLNMFLSLDRKEQLKLLGWVDPMTVHSENRKSVESKNASYERDIDAVYAWLNHASKDAPDGVDSTFYIPAEFWRQMRMGQLGSINPQNSKLHRYIFGMPEWETTFDIGTKYRTEDTLERAFMEAVGMALGIESGKKGGIEKALPIIEAKLQEEPIRKAIEEIRYVLDDNGDFNFNWETAVDTTNERRNKQIESILAGIKDGGEKMHTFKALIEYARYQRAQDMGDTTFTTDLTTEIDGMSNGPIITRTQIMSHPMNTEMPTRVHTLLRNGGYSFGSDQADVGEHLNDPRNHDAYQAVGHTWNQALLRRENHLTELFQNNAKKNTGKALELKTELTRIRAVKAVLGEFTNADGHVSKTIRGLVKKPVMTTVYGSGTPALIAAVVDALIYDGIYGKMEDIVNGKGPFGKLDDAGKADALVTLGGNVRLMANVSMQGKYVKDTQKFIIRKEDILVDGKLDVEKVFAIKLPFKSQANIHEQIATHHGAAIAEGIANVFGDIQESRKPLNSGIGVAAAHYNVAKRILLNRKLNEKLEAYKTKATAEGATDKHIALHSKDITLTVDEVKEIEKAIVGLRPRVKTPFGGYLDPTKRDRKRSTIQELEVKQKYKGNKVQRKTGYPANEDYLAQPGVSAVVQLIQSLDATIANKFMGTDTDILNCHDGFFLGLGTVREASSTLNKAMYDTMKDYDLAQEMYEGTVSALNAFHNHPELQASDADEANILYAELADEYRLMGIIREKSNGEETFDGNHEDAEQQIIEQMAGVARASTSNKAEVMSKVSNMNHYYYPGYGYETKNQGAKVDFFGSTPDQIVKEKQATLDEQAGEIKSDIEQNKEMFLENQVEWRDIYDPSTMNKKEVISWKEDQVYISQSSRSFGAPIGPAGPYEYRGNAPSNGAFDPSTFSDKGEISGMNALDTYEAVKNKSIKQVSPEHDAHLTNILSSIVTKVMGPVDLFMKTSTMPASGQFHLLKKGGMRILINNQAWVTEPDGTRLGARGGANNSTGEVYVHELIHAITTVGLKLSPELRRQGQILYDKAKEHTTFRNFLPDPNIDVDDPANKFIVAAAEKRYKYIFEKPPITKVAARDVYGNEGVAEVSNHLDEFISIGLTDESYVKFLSQLPLDTEKKRLRDVWPGIKGENIQDTLMRLYERIMDVIFFNFRKEGPRNTVGEDLQRLAVALAKVDSKNKSIIYQGVEKYDMLQTKIATKANATIKGAINKAPILKVGQHVKPVLSAAEASNTPTGKWLRGIREKINGMEYGMFQSILTEMNGITDRLGSLHGLINLKSVIVDRSREEVSNAYRNAVNKLFSREMSETEQTAMAKGVIKTDLTALRGRFSVDAIAAMVSDKNTLQGQINDIRRQFAQDKDLAPYRHYYNRMAGTMGFHMVHGKGYEAQTIMSTRVVAKLTNTKHKGKLSTAQIMKAEALIEELATMYAVKYTPQRHLDTITEIFDEQPAAMEGLMQLHQTLKYDSFTRLFNSNPSKVIKGYTKEITDPQVELEMGTAADEEILAARGFIRTTESIPRDPNDPVQEEIFIYTAQTGTAHSYLATTASFTGNRAKGTNTKHIQDQLGTEDLSVSQAHNKHLVKQKQAELDEMFEDRYIDPYKVQENYMVPQVNDAGEIIKYRYMMGEATKDTVLKKHNDAAAILGAMAGQIVDKEGTKVINAKLVQALKEMYNTDYKKNSAAYVEISPTTDDPRHRDIWHMLPEGAKAEVLKLWKGPKMYVRKDVVDLAFGYRKYSITEAFAKTPEDRKFLERVIVGFAQTFFGDMGIQRTAQVERVLMELTKYAKNNLIVRSFSVTMNNYISNILYLKMRGMGNAEILKYTKEAKIGVLRYQRDKQALDAAIIKLEIQKGRKPNAAVTQKVLDNTTKKLEVKIRELESEIALNPVTELVDAGLLQSIVDDVETSNIQSPYPGMIEEFVDGKTQWVPQKIKTVGKVFFLSEDTTAYKTLNNAVKMTDFIGRYAMYKHYTDAARGDEQMDHQDAVSQTIHEFVNFNLPTHKMIEYGNQIGLIWFSKYQLRILKIIKDSIADKPFETIATFLMATALGSANILGSVPGVTKSLLGNFGNPLGTLADSVSEIVTVDPLL